MTPISRVAKIAGVVLRAGCAIRSSVFSAMILAWLSVSIPGLQIHPHNFGERIVRVYLNGGPAHGREVTIGPNTITYLVSIPRPVEIPHPFDGMTDNFASAYDLARYVFRGTGFVSIHGVCSALIFDYQGTVNG